MVKRGHLDPWKVMVPWGPRYLEWGERVLMTWFALMIELCWPPPARWGAWGPPDPCAAGPDANDRPGGKTIPICGERYVVFPELLVDPKPRYPKPEFCEEPPTVVSIENCECLYIVQ